MAKDEKKDEKKDDVTFGSLTFDQLRTVVSAGLPLSQAKELAEVGFGYDQILELAQATAQKPAGNIGFGKDELAALLKEVKDDRSNKAHPGISAFSYPEGDVKRPKKVPPYKFLYAGYPCHMFPETEHWRELELMCQVQPGEYTVLRKDGTQMSVSVKGERDADQKLSSISVEFTATREEKYLIPPKVVLLYQLVHTELPPKRRFMEAMQEHLALTFGEVEAAEAIA